MGYFWFYFVYFGFIFFLINSDSGFVRIFLVNFLGDVFVFVGGIFSLYFLVGMVFEKVFVVGVIFFIILDFGKFLVISFISCFLF